MQEFEAIRLGQMARRHDIGKLDELTQILGISEWMISMIGSGGYSPGAVKIECMTNARLRAANLRRLPRELARRQ